MMFNPSGTRNHCVHLINLYMWKPQWHRNIKKDQKQINIIYIGLNVAHVPYSDGWHQCSAAPVPLESGAQDQRLWTGPSGRGTLPEAAERWGHAQVSSVELTTHLDGCVGLHLVRCFFFFFWFCSFTFSSRRWILLPFDRHFNNN